MALSDIWRPKWKRSSPHTRMDAIKQLTDKAILAEIAQTDADYHVRALAISKLDDESVLAAILTDPRSPGDRINAAQ